MTMKPNLKMMKMNLMSVVDANLKLSIFFFIVDIQMGGFIYIAVIGVLAEMKNSGSLYTILLELSMHEPYGFKALVDISHKAFPGNKKAMAKLKLPLLLIEALKAIGVSEVVLAINYQPEVMLNFLKEYETKLAIKITFSQEIEPLGTVGPLALARDKLIDDFHAL